MKWLQFIFSHSIFISFCAVGLCYQTYELLEIKPEKLVYYLVFSSTLCTYNAYWLLSKYHFSSGISLARFAGLHYSNVVFFLVAMVACLICVLLMPGIVGYLSVAVLLTLLYSLPLWPGRRIKAAFDFGFIKTSLLALTWAYVTVIIPIHQAFPSLDLPVLLLFTVRFLFMLMLCAIFDSRDSDIDKVHGLKSLATDVSPKVLQVIMLVTFSLYILLGIILRFELHSPVQTIALLMTGSVVLWVYYLSRRKRSYLFYYFLVDGLMLFSAIATFVAANG